eukprot:scaffold19491_cov45-Phaeocystis_antarctica.AAC.1
MEGEEASGREPHSFPLGCLETKDAHGEWRPATEQPQARRRRKAQAEAASGRTAEAEAKAEAEAVAERR